jgi:hypothetical protein
VHGTSVELYRQWRREILRENPVSATLSTKKKPTWNGFRPNVCLWIAVRLQIMLRKWTPVAITNTQLVTLQCGVYERVRQMGRILKVLVAASGSRGNLHYFYSTFWIRLVEHIQSTKTVSKQMFSKGKKVSTDHAVPPGTSCSWFSVINVMAADKFYFVLSFEMCISCIVFAHSFFPLELYCFKQIQIRRPNMTKKFCSKSSGQWHTLGW